MRSCTRTRAPFLAAFVLACALAACSDAPTGPAPDGGITPAQPAGPLASMQSLSSLPIPASISVTNSGGYPLVSWSAVSGATGYTVNLVTYNVVNGVSSNWYSAYLGTPSGTSYLDAAHPWTGTYACTAYEDDQGNTYGAWFVYEVVTHFVNGTSSILHFAYIATPYCG